MNAMPVVSIIVPVYNVERWLGACMSSILSQTYTRIEVILVDDGSTDGCSSQCDAWAWRDDRVRVIHQPNRGLSVARNAGLEASNGECVLFVDSDDEITEDLVEVCVETRRRTDARIVAFPAQPIDEQGNDLDSSMLGRFPRSGVVPSSSALRFLADETVDGCACMGSYAQLHVADRTLYDGLRFPVGKRFEDVATTYRLFDSTDAIALVNRPMYRYRQRAGSILHAADLTGAFSEGVDIHRERIAYMVDHHPELVGEFRLGFVTWMVKAVWQGAALPWQREGGHLPYLRRQIIAAMDHDIRKRMPKMTRLQWALSRLHLAGLVRALMRRTMR